MAGATVVGVFLALQARINGALGAELDDGIAAGTISFAGGLVVLLVGTALLPQGRRGVRRLAAALQEGGGLRPWQCLGGVCGGYLVFSQGMAAAELGVALFTIAVVAGQITSSLLVDRFGLGPAGPQRVTANRLIGAALTLVAVVVAVSAKLSSAHVSWMVLLPLLAGAGVGWQAAVNGRVQQAAGSTLTAGAVNFAVGFTALAIAFSIEVLLRGFPELTPQPWLYTGGLLGIFVIGGSVGLVRYTGVLLLSLGMISGQLIGALLLDLLLLLPAAGTGISVSTVAGVLITLLAAAVASMPDRAGRAVPRLPR